MDSIAMFQQTKAITAMTQNSAPLVLLGPSCGCNGPARFPILSANLMFHYHEDEPLRNAGCKEVPLSVFLGFGGAVPLKWRHGHNLRSKVPL